MKRWPEIKAGSEVELPVEALDVDGQPVALSVADCRCSIRHQDTGELVVDAGELEAGEASHQAQFFWTVEEPGPYLVEFFLVDTAGTETYCETIEILVFERVAT